MKNTLKIFVSIVLLGSYIMTGCAKDNPVGGDPPGAASAHLYSVEGRVTEIVGKNLVLVNVLEENKDFQEGDTLAIRYGSVFEWSDELGDILSEHVVQKGDIVNVYYGGWKKRNIGEIENCNYVSVASLYVMQKVKSEK